VNSYFRGLCSRFAPLECILNYTGGNSDTGLQSRKGKQLMVLHTAAYISEILILPLSGGFSITKKTTCYCKWVVMVTFKAVVVDYMFP